LQAPLSSANAYGQVADPSKKSAQDREEPWVGESKRLIEKLRSLANDTPKIGSPDRYTLAEWLKSVAPQMDKLVDCRYEGNELLWDLWLLTGQCPQIDKGKSLDEYLRDNAVMYQEYVSRHASLSEEEVVRLALTAAIDTFASSRWYMTLRYLEKKVGFRTITHDGERVYIIVHVTPSYKIIESPLSNGSYGRLRVAIKRWLSNNKDGMIWDSTVRQFRPREKYRGDAELTDAVLRAMEENEKADSDPKTGKGGGR
jgi:hypothetical protein